MMVDYYVLLRCSWRQEREEGTQEMPSTSLARGGPSPSVVGAFTQLPSARDSDAFTRFAHVTDIQFQLSVETLYNIQVRAQAVIGPTLSRDKLDAGHWPGA